MKTIGIPKEMYYYKDGFVLKNLFEFLGCNVLIDDDIKNVDYIITNKKDIKEEIIKNVEKLYKNEKKILLVGLPHVIHNKNVINEIELKYKNMEIIYSDLFDNEIDVINFCLEYVDYIVIYKNNKKEVSIEKQIN